MLEAHNTMPHENIVAVYDTMAHADAAVHDLEAASIPSSAITRHSGSETAVSASPQPAREQGFWASLFGGESDQDTSVYDRSMNSGSSVVAVRVSNGDAQRITGILERHSPIDMEERAASYGVTTDAATIKTTTSSPQMHMGAGLKDGEQVIGLAEAQLTVGKRLVNQGTTRIRRFVVDKPVEENVTLRSEHVSVERRPVAAGTRPTDANFTDHTIEVTETKEEAVVGKSARVVEEVVVSKGATERVETVKDTVRREDIEVTRDGGTDRMAGTARPAAPPAQPRI